MAYVNPKGLSRGIGQAATCPSLEQLQGIVDLSDPCQAGVVLANSQQAASSGAMASSLLTWGLVGVGAILLFGIVSGGRR